MSDNQEGVYEELLEKVKKYTRDTSMIEKAYFFALDAHKEQLRQSGQPYIVHPIGVALILAEMELDVECITAGLLHDVIEDVKDISFEIINKEFGETVANLVQGVTNLDKINFISKEERQVENLRKMFLAMASDIRVIIIKLADRLNNMRTLKHMTDKKQREKAVETLEVYAPLAHRLGLQRIKWELEDLSLIYLDSVAYYEIVEGVKQKKQEREEYIDRMIKTFEDKTNEMNIKASVYGRAKHFYSIYRKMFNQGKSLEEIYDLFAVRIIVDTVSDCYAVLGMVHEMFKPIPGRFKDYIAMPKPNKYQSLHTTVIGYEGKPFEVQIRTWKMHGVAENGVAAHWKYKEGVTGKSEMDDALLWIREMLEVQNDLNEKAEFVNTLKIDLFADEVFVFTPKGDVFNLPLGSTPIDFAFTVHSAVGYKMIGAKVNSKIVPLDYTLVNGDIVEILTSSVSHGPKLDWLKIAKTSQARNKINQWFKKEKREENLERGKDLLEKEIKKSTFTHDELLKPEYLEQVLRRYNFNTFEDMCVSVGCNGIAAARVVTRLIDYNKEIQNKIKESEILAKLAEKPVKKRVSGVGIIVEGEENCLIRLSKCCNPIPGDDIIGFITKGRGVSVHRKDCVNVKKDNLNDASIQRLIGCEWQEAFVSNYQCQLQIEATNRQGILADITNAITELKLPVNNLNARVTKERIAVVELVLEVTDKSQIELVIKRLYRVPGVFEVTRSRN